MTCAPDRGGRTIRLSRVLFVLAVATATGPALGGGTPATNGGATGVQRLLTPAGAATTLANGEYVTNTAGLNSYYRFFVEVPPGVPRLRVQLFDPDTTGLNDVDASTFRYSLFDPSGTQRATALSSDAGPAASNNVWWTLYDSAAATAYVLDQFGAVSYTNSDGTLPWSSPWVEENDNGNPASGRFLITGGVLRMNPRAVTNVAIARSADLSGLASATLSFSTDGRRLDEDERVEVEYSTDGGANWTTLQSLYPGNALANWSYAVSPAPNSRIRFRRGGSGWADDEWVDIDNVRIEGPLAVAAAGHWEVRMTGTAGDGANGVGVRADDGDATSGGTELNVYYHSFFNYGTTSGARTFVDHPWVTGGCSFTSNDFDGDDNGSITLASRTGAFTSATFGVSTNNAWLSNTVSGWTTASDATDYGLWTMTFVVPNDLNCITYYAGAFDAAATPPTAQPEASTIRVYLPTDAGGKPAKPYAEQQVRHITGAGPNPVVVGQTSRFTVTVRVVNPTAWPITFSNAAGNVVTASVPGAGTVYAGNAQVSQGGVISQPAIGGTGTVAWDPGVLAAGATAIVAYEVNVTPAAAGSVNVTGTPAAAGTRATFLDETANAAQPDQTRNTLGPLCQLSVSTVTPTLALLGETRASSASPGVLVEWETVSEAGTAGFEVYRIAGGEREPVHSGVLEAGLAPAGARYRLHDREARPRGDVRYEIVEVESDGTRRSLGFVTFDPNARDEAGTSGPGDGGSYTAEPRAPESPRRPTRARQDARPLAVGRADGLEAASGFTGMRESPSLRIETAAEGLTVVPWSDVAATLGLKLQTVESWVRSGRLALRRHDGTPAAWAEGAGGLLFWAEPFDSLHARGSVYRLTLERGTPMASRKVSGFASPSIASFTARLHEERDLVDVVALPISPSADYWLWQGFIAGRPGFDRASFPLAVPGLARGEAQLTVGLQGASAETFGSHHVRVLVNGGVAGEASFSGFGRLDATFDLPDGALVEGANTITLEAIRDAGTSQSLFYLDSFDLSYPRRYDALGAASFVFEAPASSPVTVTGLPAGEVALFDVTSPSSPVILAGFSSGAGELRFSTPPHSGRYAIAVDGAAVRPWALGVFGGVDSKTGPRAGATYVVVTSSELLGEANRLAQLRAVQGLSTYVVTFQAVADQFAGGVRDPEALRAFLEQAASTWQTPPRYVVLAGSGSYDYRDLYGYGANHVPALLRSSTGGLFPADRDFATTASRSPLPIAVGRIPARNATELRAAIDKIAAYEGATGSPAWASKAVFLADDAEGGADFAEASDQAEARLRLAMTKERLHVGPLSVAAVRSALLARFEEGFGLLSYFGHAGIDRIAAEQLLTNADVEALAPSEGTPLVVALTCVLNRFGVPGFTALGESLTTREGAGAVAVWSSSGLSDHASSLALAQRFLGALGPDTQTRLGDALATAASAYVAAEGHAETLAFYNLIGDPALVVRRPSATSAPGTGKGR